ncbi:extracellular solute-binding protein [Glycomyces sp. TRM65418]|uniref:ABC transporter substrate-binding protein n=1 Tax=Glycomyces sp. TRM65418 TaxID=2867006 RepID=UPI001CE60DD3|nr:extracellular solute-binding protein [Glycomyces sp. TRM65418]MCC3763457.1 extracellular solute-binding protein [Glycomyces sp. TRM65418]QZD57446.1 extracellular solute-binding protein [Glycomyces sp. TRM65418]
MIHHPVRNPIRRRTLLTGAAATAALGAAAACGDDGPAGTADDPVTISFEWWGDDARAEVTKQAVDLFTAKNEGIEVRTNFADYPVYWEGLTGRMASRDLPDVFQMDYPRLRQFGSSGMLLPLDGLVKTDDFREGMLDTATLDGQLIAVPVGSNVFGLIYRADWFEEHGIAPPEAGYTWEDYGNLVAELTTALGEGRWGGVDWASSYLFLELWLRQQGGSFYSDDAASLNFTQEQLVEWWGTSVPFAEQGAIPSAETVAEWTGGGMAGDLVATEIRWDTAINGYWSTVTDNGGRLDIAPPPTADPGNLALHLRPSVQYVIGANTEQAEASAKLIDFLLHDPEAIAVMGTNRGIPSTNTGLESVELDEASQAVIDYEATVDQHLADAPVMPPAAAGAIEAKYTEIYEQVQYGQMTPDEAASLFFTEAETLFASEQ